MHVSCNQTVYVSSHLCVRRIAAVRAQQLARFRAVVDVIPETLRDIEGCLTECTTCFELLRAAAAVSIAAPTVMAPSAVGAGDSGGSSTHDPPQGAVEGQWHDVTEDGEAYEEDEYDEGDEGGGEWEVGCMHRTELSSEP